MRIPFLVLKTVQMIVKLCSKVPRSPSFKQPSRLCCDFTRHENAVDFGVARPDFFINRTIIGRICRWSGTSLGAFLSVKKFDCSLAELIAVKTILRARHFLYALSKSREIKNSEINHASCHALRVVRVVRVVRETKMIFCSHIFSGEDLKKSTGKDPENM